MSTQSHPWIDYPSSMQLDWVLREESSCPLFVQISKMHNNHDNMDKKKFIVWSQKFDKHQYNIIANSEREWQRIPWPTRLDGIVHSFFEFNGHLTKFTVIEELTETLPGGRVVARRVVQPMRENCLTTILIIHSLGPHLKLLSCSHQVADPSPLVVYWWF